MGNIGKQKKCSHWAWHLMMMMTSQDDSRLSGIALGVSLDNRGRQVSIARAQPIHTGNYTCLATNAAGTSALTTLLTVLTLPAWNDDTEFDSEVVGVAGEELHLYCNVHAIPSPSILWLKDGQVITNETDRVTIEESEKLLSVSAVEGDDGGRYTCISSNPAGTAEFDFEVSILAPPTLAHLPKSEYTVLMNRAVSLECPVEGTPDPDIEWVVDGRTAGDSEQFMRMSSARRHLHILRVLASSKGHVSCIATNAVGKLVTNYTLDILSPPTITAIPSSRKAKLQEGEVLTISCKASGTPKPQIAWVVAGEQVLTESELIAAGLEVQDEGESLTILDANGEHQGRYTCIASNAAGSAEENFDVQVLLPPFIAEPEMGTNLEAVQGTSISLVCVVDARPQATIIWFKENKPLDVNKDPFIHITSGGEQLRFLRVLPHHTDNYTCVTSNSAGEAMLTYELKVMVPPVIIEDMVENTIGGGVGGETMGIVGGDVDLECYTLGTPTPALTWTKDEEVRRIDTMASMRQDFCSLKAKHQHLTSATALIVIKAFARDSMSFPSDRFWLLSSLLCSDGLEDVKTNGRIVLLEDDQILRLNEAQTEDSGRYTCTATSASGSASRDFVVIIHSPPRIISQLDTNIDVIVNQPLVLNCEAESSLKAVISWTRHGRPVMRYSDPNLQVRRGGEELHLLRVREGDGGPFTCVAINTAGHDTLTYTLTVQVPPTIERANLRQQITAIEKQNVNMLCEASGSPLPSVSWYKGSMLITPEHPHFEILDEGEKLQIIEVDKSDEGIITCSAKNPAGQDSVSFTLQVLVSPSVAPEAATEVTVNEGESIALNCPVEGDPAPSIIWSMDGTIIGSSGRDNIDVINNQWSLRITRARNENSGVYTCTATNAAGITDIPITLFVLGEYLQMYGKLH
ncbi:hypothetical protein SK128_001568 [Halocaridina rubra]|uniref:Ig-like domain-containing protein n=1 Tax=Halocaridina rubra TaxID=373956 RepID=A0AAN8XV99_HALRR